MPHVILTGASGFVGSHVLRHLLTETDWTIACPVSFRHKGLPARIAVALRDGDPSWVGRVDPVVCDLSAPLDRLSLSMLGASRCDYVLNLASQSHVDRSISDPVPFVENNVSLVLNMLEAARQMPDLKAFVQISTDEVYGPAPLGRDSREWDPIIPSNPYAASKAAQEAIAVSYWRTFGVPLIITNTMNIIGETQDVEKMVPSTIRKVLNGETVTIHADTAGNPGSRFYLHARNQADALLFLIQPEEPWRPELFWSPFFDRPSRVNVVGEREIDNLAMAHLIAEYVGRPLRYKLVDFHSSRPGHDLRYAMDGSTMRDFGWKPPVPLEDSLRRTVEWTLAHPEWLA